MIKTPTVLVLGAGVSKPYGFPCGMEMVEMVHDNLLYARNQHWNRILKDCQIDKGVCEAFAKELRQSQFSSVDAFLETCETDSRRIFLEVGKLAMALTLVRSEREKNLLDFSKRELGCYHYLLDKLHAPFEHFDQNRLSIITFNYDRSLEHALMVALKSRSGRSVTECANKIRGIEVVHLYGSLGKLEWQADGGRAYGAECDANSYKAISQEIKVVFEGQDESEEFDRAFQLLDKAERIYFLGFSYLTTNLRRLRLHKAQSVKQGISVLGTALGMGADDIRRVQKETPIRLPDPSSHALQFLKNHAELS